MVRLPNLFARIVESVMVPNTVPTTISTGSNAIPWILSLFLSLDASALAQQTPMPTANARPQLHLLDRGEIDVTAASGWNRIVLISQPRLAEGATELVPSSFQTPLSQLWLTICAEVVSNPQSQQYELKQVGIAYCVEKKGKLCIVSNNIASTPLQDLGFYGRQILSENEKQLRNVRLVGSDFNWLMFDAEAMVRQQDSNLAAKMRHAIYFDPNRNAISTLVWLIPSSSNGNSNVSENTRPAFHRVPENTREDRRIFVDRNQFFLGIPNSKAFGLMALPGEPTSIPNEAHRSAMRSVMTPQELSEFLRQLSPSMSR